jgi:hypothetical protein
LAREHYETSIGDNVVLNFGKFCHGMAHPAPNQVWTKCLQAMVIFHKVPNMSRDMFIKKTFIVDGYLENEPVFGRVKFTLDGF